MNRFIIGGILAALVVALTGGLNRIMGDRNSQTQLTGVDRNNTEGTGTGGMSDLGSLPIEQAGQLAQRQSEVGNNGTRATSDFIGQNNGQDIEGMPSGGRPDISPGTTGTSGNVIPRTSGTATFPPTGGDIAPVNPDLVQPGAGQRPTDPDLDSIPALW